MIRVIRIHEIKRITLEDVDTIVQGRLGQVGVKKKTIDKTKLGKYLLPITSQEA